MNIKRMSKYVTKKIINARNNIILLLLVHKKSTVDFVFGRFVGFDEHKLNFDLALPTRLNLVPIWGSSEIHTGNSEIFTESK
jgi:hypothetical protein